MDRQRIIEQNIHNYTYLGYCSGTFDLLHPGHLIFLNKCKQYLFKQSSYMYNTCLLVGIGSDKTIEVYKKRKPIINERARIYQLEQLKCVDLAFIQNDMVKQDDEMKIIADDLRDFKPRYYFLNKDATNLNLRLEYIEKHFPEIKVVLMDRDYPEEIGEYSTSGIITKIGENYIFQHYEENKNWSDFKSGDMK